MMIIAVNGSPRKSWNTHTMLAKALEGATAAGVETELINLYDASYKGCIGCLGCKRKSGSSTGRCAVKDGLTPALENIHACDGLIVGSPIYFGEVTGEMRSFMERLLFPYLSYDADRTSLFGRRMPTAFIYTMNVPEALLDRVGYTERFKANEALFERILGPCKTLIATETHQIDDYDNYNMSMFNAAERKQRHEEIFPEDCRKAFELGTAMAKQR